MNIWSHQRRARIFKSRQHHWALWPGNKPGRCATQEQEPQEPNWLGKARNQGEGGQWSTVPVIIWSRSSCCNKMYQEAKTHYYWKKVCIVHFCFWPREKNDEIIWIWLGNTDHPSYEMIQRGDNTCLVHQSDLGDMILVNLASTGRIKGVSRRQIVRDGLQSRQQQRPLWCVDELVKPTLMFIILLADSWFMFSHYWFLHIEQLWTLTKSACQFTKWAYN